MREVLLALLLAMSAFAGCLQDGEPIGSTDVDAPANGSDDEQDGHDHGDHEHSSDESSDASSDDSESSTNQTSDSSTSSNQTADASDGNQTSSTDHGQDAATKKAPWNLTRSVGLGFQVGVGAAFLPDPVGSRVGDNGLVSEDRCPSANVTIPKSATTLTMSLDGALIDADEPGVGAYQVGVTGAGGENATLGGVNMFVPTMDAMMNWTVEDPTAGIWKMDADALGPSVQQTWTLSISLEGKAKSPPSSVQVTIDC